MNLKYIDGVFVFECGYMERHLPKDAGFQWHTDSCSQKWCPACLVGLGKGWFTASDVIAEKLIGLADESAIAALSESKKSREATLRQSHAQESDIEIPAPAGLDYLPYQRAGVAFAASREAALIGDEMGLGKTIQTIGLINYLPGIRRALVVCPASLKINWKRELKKWLMPEREWFIGIADSKSFPRADIVIINYDILGHHREELRRLPWDLLVLDEGHFIKNPDANRSKEVYGGKVRGAKVPPIPAKRRLILTGTPIENRPAEIWALWRYLDPDGCPTQQRFMQTYYESEPQEVFIRGGGGKKRKITSYTEPRNLDDLQYRLRTTVMIRRKTADVLTELPPKRRQIIEIPQVDAAELIQQEFAAYREYKAAISARENARTLANERDYRERITRLRENENQSMANLASARKRLALKKVPFVAQHTEEMVDSAGKVVLFAYHREVIERLRQRFGASAVHLYGGMSAAEKQAAIDAFDNDPRVTVFVASIIAAGVGLNLTVSNHQIFAELDWVPGRIEQAEKRCHRIGQERPVLIQHIHFEESLDAFMAKKIIEKQAHIEKALDKQEPLSQGANSHV